MPISNRWLCSLVSLSRWPLKLCLFLLVVLTATQAFGQTRDQPKSPGPPGPGTTIIVDPEILAGVLEDRTYTNKFFGLSVSLPRDWTIVDRERRDWISKESKRVISNEDSERKEKVNASIDRSVNLLTITKLPSGQPHNANLMLIAERIPSPLIKNGVDGIRLMQETTKNTNFTLEFQGPIHIEKIGTAEFGVATIKNTSPYGVLMQKVYMMVKNGYALQFFYTYLDEADLPAFDSIMKRVRMR